MGKDYDFAGWVTKNDIRCADGVTIKRDAFQHNNNQTVPLVWNHDSSSPTNILGRVVLQNQPEGVYGFGTFNETEDAQHAKELIKHGDINAMSIGARKVKRNGTDVIHGLIYEVSLVMAGANPGAKIETVMAHSDNDDTESSIIYTDCLLHSAEDVVELKHKEETDEMPTENEEKTIGQVLDTMTEEQQEAVEALVAYTIEQMEDEIEQSVLEEGEETMKHNVFESSRNEETLQHAANFTAALNEAITNEGKLSDSLLAHSITNIEYLFPEAKIVGDAPQVYRDRNTSAMHIVDGVHKSPFARLKTLIADLTDEEARARGYIKGNEKLEQVFELLYRTTDPQTIYKKQKLDRDDVIDITDYNIVAFIQTEMKFMLKEEIARAILVGDGRVVSSPDKIKEDKIRPIISDDDFYSIKKDITGGIAGVIEAVIKGKAEYQGSGVPELFMHPLDVADLKLLKKTDGSFLFGDIPSEAAMATRLGVKSIVPTTFLEQGKMIMVNLADYTLGSTKGGEVTNFDDFDIDFNQYKYLIETRLSGALMVPKSAIVFTMTEDGGGVTP